MNVILLDDKIEITLDLCDLKYSVSYALHPYEERWKVING